MLLPSIFLIASLQAPPASPGVAYSNSQPVRINSCSLTPDPTTTTNAFAIRKTGADAIRIAFVNQDVKPISAVSFDVTDDRVTTEIEDRGTFSGGVAIDHRFDARDFSNAFAGVTCTVEHVLFADGTNWNAH